MRIGERGDQKILRSSATRAVSGNHLIEQGTAFLALAHGARCPVLEIFKGQAAGAVGANLELLPELQEKLHMLAWDKIDMDGSIPLRCSSLSAY